MNDPAAASALSRLLDEALDLPPDERIRWVDTIDPAFEGLKPRLRALLERAAEVESRDFLNTLPPLGDADPAGAARNEAAGVRVGPYRLEKQIGSGGMGTVWLATRADGLFERSIALKLPHRGMFGADLAERMARERSILAGLDHPNIARLYDAGLTDDGQPYLALEYVEGLPIDEYCRRNQCDMGERLRLFLQVANAVASAHARLVVHRDLKPANILVTADGNVRLLDFGIAKLLDTPSQGGESLLTQMSGNALTPDYASPEQILGEPVTIVSDVYSLGVVFYELLTGERPYRLRRDTRGALEEAILQTEPRRPSEVASVQARELRGDLDTIVLKALRKPPAERYATVNAFADDIQRHRDGRTVLARPDTAWYRASRFVRRNRIAVAAAATVALALIGGAVVATIGLVQARAAEQRALAQAETARQVSGLLVDLFKVSDPGEARGNTITAREILDKAAVRIEGELAAAPSIRATMMGTIAEVYGKLGLYSAGLPLAAKALNERRASSPGTAELADSLDRVGELQTLSSEPAKAAPLHLEALALRRSLANPDDAAIAATLQRLGEARYVEHKYDLALEYVYQAQRVLDQMPQSRLKQLGEVTKYIANLLHEQGKVRDAIPVYRDALNQLRTALGADHPSVAAVLGDLAIALKDTQQYPEAERAYLESLAILRKTLGEHHPDVANSLSNLSVMNMDTGNFESALANSEAATNIYREALGDEHRQTNIARLNAARAHVQLGHFETAESEIRTILAIRRRTLGNDDMSIGLTCDALADVLNKEQRFREAEPLAREAQQNIDKTFGPQHWRSAAFGRTLGVALAGQHRYAEAELVLVRSYEVMVIARGKSNRTTLLSLTRLVELYEAWGKPEQAAQWKEKGVRTN